MSLPSEVGLWCAGQCQVLVVLLLLSSFSLSLSLCVGRACRPPSA